MSIASSVGGGFAGTDGELALASTKSVESLYIWLEEGKIWLEEGKE